MSSLLDNCYEYIKNIYDTAHTSNIPYLSVLASGREDIHNLILAKLGVGRDKGILEITNNLDKLNDMGRGFDAAADHTDDELREVARALLASLEIYCSRWDCKIQRVECITGRLKNFTNGNVYAVFGEDEESLFVVDDQDRKYEIDKSMQIPVKEFDRNMPYDFRIVC